MKTNSKVQEKLKYEKKEEEEEEEYDEEEEEEEDDDEDIPENATLTKKIEDYQNNSIMSDIDKKLQDALEKEKKYKRNIR